MLQGSGDTWRVTKYIRFLEPMLKPLPLSMLERNGDADVKTFVAFLKVSLWHLYSLRMCPFELQMRPTQDRVLFHSDGRRAETPPDFQDADPADHDRSSFKHSQ